MADTEFQCVYFDVSGHAANDAYVLARRSQRGQREAERWLGVLEGERCFEQIAQIEGGAANSMGYAVNGLAQIRGDQALFDR